MNSKMTDINLPSWASSNEAQKSFELVRNLQKSLAKSIHGLDLPFKEIQWLRDGGRHGGGNRLQAQEGGFFNRGSINVSQVHYDDKPNIPLSSATALSTILHPDEPRHPSLHLHISYTQRKGEQGEWRLMADLNPSQPSQLGGVFRKSLELFNIEDGVDAFAQGDQYFWIPSRNRHRGISHFYLEAFNLPDFETELKFASDFGEKVILTYSSFLLKTLLGENTSEERQRQLEYHSLYFFQVLLLDKGTTAGLLVHDQNDEGILASLPSRVDFALLKKWTNDLQGNQDQLLEKILELKKDDIVDIDTQLKLQLAKIIREHYEKFPDDLNHQSHGFKTTGPSNHLQTK